MTLKLTKILCFEFYDEFKRTLISLFIWLEKEDRYPRNLMIGRQLE